MQIILQRYANREYRLTQQNIVSSERQKGDKYADRKNSEYAEAVISIFVLSKNLEHGLMCDSDTNGGRVRAVSEWDVRRGIRALDIIDEFQQNAGSRKNKGGWGFAAKPTSFTRNARHRLLEAGAVIDQEFGKNVYEVTLTLPGSTTEAMQLVADWSGWLCNRLLREVNRNAVTSHWFYVWERQKRGALHLHFAIAGSDLTEVKKVAEKLEYQWFELLLELKEKTSVDAFKRRDGNTWRDKPQVWQSHVASIRKSVAAYFSKYAGKSASSDTQTNNRYCPSRWWGSSRAVKQSIELRRHKYVLDCSKEDSKEIYSYLHEWLDSPGRIKNYSYGFDLGKSKLGTPLGGGHVEINYYDDDAFLRMQTWEPYVMELLQTWLKPTQTSQMYYKNSDSTPPRSPHSQQLTQTHSKVKQGVRRRTPYLALRARLVEYLNEETGGNVQQLQNLKMQEKGFKQLELF